MGIAEIDAWVDGRLRTPEGGWDVDTALCIFYTMEGRTPESAVIGDDIGKLQEYQRLVEVLCEFLKEHPNTREAVRLRARIYEDARNLHRFNEAHRHPLCQTAEQTLGYCFEKANAL